MDYSLIITAWKEPDTVAKNLTHILDPQFGNNLSSMEIILVCPDSETHQAALHVIETYKFANFKYVQDEQKGKPYALNLGLAHAQGNILLFTDGDVYIGAHALPKLVEAFRNAEVGGVSGRPVSSDQKSNLFGYWGHMLADAAHDKRSHEATKNRFYFMSGYLYAIRRLEGLEFPVEVLSDDAWITLQMIEKGYKIAYEPEACVFVKYPRHFADWIKQKRRSMGGYSQLAQKSTLRISKRSFFEEVRYAVFPLRYAQSMREFFYSLLLYPGRLWLWCAIWYTRMFQMDDPNKVWKRIESTK